MHLNDEELAARDIVLAIIAALAFAPDMTKYEKLFHPNRIRRFVGRTDLSLLIPKCADSTSLSCDGEVFAVSKNEFGFDESRAVRLAVAQLFQPREVKVAKGYRTETVKTVWARAGDEKQEKIDLSSLDKEVFRLFLGSRPDMDEIVTIAHHIFGCVTCTVIGFGTSKLPCLEEHPAT